MAQNQALFTAAISNAVWLQISGVDRFTFFDAAWGSEVPWGRPPALAIDASLVWFFATYIKEEDPPFPANQEIINVKRK